MSRSNLIVQVIERECTCCACGSRALLKTREGYTVCSKCGLVIDETPAFQNPDVFNSPDFPKKKVHAYLTGSEYGSVINLGIDKMFRASARNLATTHQRNCVERKNQTDQSNRLILDSIVNDVGIDHRTAERAKDALKIIQKKSKDLCKESRRTRGFSNVLFIGALLSVIDKRVNIRETYTEGILKWITTSILESSCIGEKTSRMCVDVIGWVQERQMTIDDWKLVSNRINNLLGSMETRTENIIKQTRSTFNKFKNDIDDRVDFLRDDKKHVMFMLSKAGINLHVKKILKLLDMINEPGLPVEDLARACTSFVYAYYDKPAPFPNDSRVKKSIELIERKCGFFLRDDTPDACKADIVRPRMIVTDRNEFWNEVFNDEYDKVLEATMQFCDEVSRNDLELILSLVTNRYIDMHYMKCMLREMRREHVLDLFKRAPFVAIDGNDIEYSAFITDIEKEMQSFLKNNAPTRTVPGARTTIFIGTRRAKRMSRDMYSMNVMISKRDGSGEYMQWIPVGEVKEIVDFIYEQDRYMTAGDVVSCMMAKNFSFSTTGKAFTSNQRYKVYVTCQILNENGFFNKKEQYKYKPRVSIEEIYHFIDSIEIKNDVIA